MPAAPSSLWPAPLHHLALASPEPARLAAFLADALQMRSVHDPGGAIVLSGPSRLIVIESGAAPGAVRVAYALGEPERVARLRERLTARGVSTLPHPSPFFRSGAFAVSAPSGVPLLFGAPADPDSDPGRNGSDLSGRLQHVVFRTPQPEPLLDFLVEKAGFVLSDRVEDDDRALTAGFVRSDPEHHSFAAFRASRPAFDHFALEADDWNALRDWADHFSALKIPIWWGPGRHGPGNNLFLMIRDPDGNRIEISAEMEHMARDAEHRVWPLEDRTLNLWGTAWMRT